MKISCLFHVTWFFENISITSILLQFSYYRLFHMVILYLVSSVTCASRHFHKAKKLNYILAT